MIVAKASGQDDAYLGWMVFATLVVVGVATLLQVRRLGPVGAGAVLPLFTAAFSIPFCITALVDGGPATLTTLILASAAFQLIISKWLFFLRRIVTPTISGTVMMILSITLASAVFGLLDDAAESEPVAAPLTALVTLMVVGALTLRGSPVWRLWAPMIGIVVGSVAAAAFGIYDFDRVTEAGWVGLPTEWLGLGVDFSIPFWTLLPAFLFLGVIISIQVNGESISLQRVARRGDLAIDFREVQGALAGTGVCNVLAGVAGTVPNIVSPGIVSYTQVTGVASRRVGYCVGGLFIALAFLPKVSGLLSSLPGPVMAGYLILITGTLFVDGARTVIQTEQDRQKLTVAGVSFWIGAAFQFGLFSLPDLGSVWGTLLKSGVTTGGFAVVAMILFLELTSHRRMRFESKLHIEVLPELSAFVTRFADRRGWDTAMKDRLNAVAEETLLTLAPLKLDLDGDDWSWLRQAKARWRIWNSSAAAAKRTWRTESDSSSSTTRRLLPRVNSPCSCCGTTPPPCGISSITAPISSPFASTLPGRRKCPEPPRCPQLAVYSGSLSPRCTRLSMRGKWLRWSSAPAGRRPWDGSNPAPVRSVLDSALTSPHPGSRPRPEEGGLRSG